MKATITLDLDESPVFTMKDINAISVIAKERGITEGEVITELAKESLQANRATASKPEEEAA